MSNFITNDKIKNLRERLLELIKNCKEMKFLVGYFYFSGIKELYESLIKKPNVTMKILVGMNTDNTIETISKTDFTLAPSIDDKRNAYLSDLKKTLSNEALDTSDYYEQVPFFIDMIMKDRLLIRKTREPNHSKLYFFRSDSGFKTEAFITGSSNLTFPGLTKQAEFNVEISDYGTKEAEDYFDDLWESSIEITEKDDIKTKVVETIKIETMVRRITPFEAYVLSLKTYLDAFKAGVVGDSLIDLMRIANYTPYKYQLDAVSQAKSIIEQNNGVIISDVVGLGKTIIACAIGHELKKRGIVICPPGLVGDQNRNSGWRMYLGQFNMPGWEVRSLGDLERTAEFVRKTNDIEIVIIDEAHRFRNQNTQDYEHLRNICRDKIVILLTATPFNNRPGDFLSLLKLFISPKKSAITLQNNLERKFKEYQSVFDKLAYIKKNYKSLDSNKKTKAEDSYVALIGSLTIDINKVNQRTRILANEIRDVIEPVTIRRNRLDLQKNPAYSKEVNNLSKVDDPVEWFFELTSDQLDFYDKILSVYFANPDEDGRFTGAIYRPFVYEKDIDRDLTEEENFEYIMQQNLSNFMRRLLVKRFESSFSAFEKSIVRFKGITEKCLAFIEKTGKYILNRKLLENIEDRDADEIEEILDEIYSQYSTEKPSNRNRVFDVNEFEKKKKFIKHIRSDIRLFEEILLKLEEEKLVENDPKGECLVNNAKKVLSSRVLPGEPKRKIVVFTEYRDTLEHLAKILGDSFGNRVYVAYSLTGTTIQTIANNFDASSQNQCDDYDILLGTDKISEGFNLNRAGMVVNYDIPWNPVRVIQRLGRINRISKKVFSTLNIVNFFPTEKGAERIKSREIASAKMFMIHSILGEDAKIFDADEEPSAAELYKRINRNPDDNEEESFFTKMVNRFEDITKTYPDLVKELNNFPPRVKVSKVGKTDEQLILFRKGRLFIQGISYDEPSQVTQYSFEDALEKIECNVNEPRLELSNKFWKNYEKVKIIKETTGSKTSPQSSEAKARNNLKTILQSQIPEFSDLQPFINTLLEDIDHFGTLPDYTLRRIAELKLVNSKQIKDAVDALIKLKDNIGADYLQKEKARLSKTKKEIIISIENQVI